MSEINKKPEIRFKGFTDDLKKKKLGDLCLIGDINHRMPQSVINGIPYLMTGDFVGINDLDFENSKQISTEDYEQLSKKIKPEEGDILFARYASVGAVRYVETQMKFLISYSCAILKHNVTANGKYLFYYLQANQIQRQIELVINTGSQRNIGIDSLKNLSILLPQEKEQEQEEVAIFLTNLDHLITLHQRKYDKLLTIKKAMLEKMFPKNGANVPEIRFKGFSEAWELRKLVDVSKITTGCSNREDSCLDGEFTFFDRSEDIRTSNIFLFDCEAIIVAGEGSDFEPKYFMGKFDLHQRTYAIMNFDSTDGKFLYYYIFLFRKYFLDQAVGSTVKSLRLPMFQKMPIELPSKPEQSKIGSYFAQLDNLITLQQREFEKLKNIKKACLEKMFV